ncbi:MAG: hypothetical protein U0746_04235 [Gemmataceae bacterium]
MAKKSGGGGGGGGESGNTGLVVSLVIAVLLAIGLGVTTYLGYSGQAEFQKQAADAKSKADTTQKALNEKSAVLAALRIAAGVESAEDKTTFAGAKGQFASAIQSQLNAISTKVPQAKWDFAAPGASDNPPKSYIKRMQELEDEVKAVRNQGDGKAQDLETKMRALADELADAKTKFNQSQDNLKKAQAEIELVRKQKHEGADAVSKKVGDLSSEKNALELARQDLDVKLSAEIKKAKELADSKERKLAELRDRVGPLLERIDAVRQARPEVHEVGELYDLITKNLAPFSAVANDTPKGSITRIDRGANIVYVNLGSADYVRPGLTFSVLPSGTTGKTAAGRDRKGAIEIVAVLEPHLSSAKVIDAPNALRDPLLPGDLLFNPAWSPTSRMHVALAGIFDLNGDGIDDIQEVISTLRKAGVEVDAYLDIKDRTIKGPGISERTTYLIEGVPPKPSGAQAIDSNSPVQQALMDLLGKHTEFVNKSRDLGVDRVPYLKFLAMVGYRLPKVGNPIDGSASSYLRDDKGKIKPTEKDEKPK